MMIFQSVTHAYSEKKSAFSQQELNPHVWPPGYKSRYSTTELWTTRESYILLLPFPCTVIISIKAKMSFIPLLPSSSVQCLFSELSLELKPFFLQSFNLKNSNDNNSHTPIFNDTSLLTCSLKEKKWLHCSIEKGDKGKPLTILLH